MLGRERRFGTHGGGEGRMHIVAAAHLQVVYVNSVPGANHLSGESSLGRIVSGASVYAGEMYFHGAKCPWGENS